MRQFYKITISFLVLLFAATLNAQKSGSALIDSLLVELPKVKSEKQKAMMLNDISNYYSQTDPDKCVQYGEQALAIGQKNNWKDVTSRSLNMLGMAQQRRKNYDAALDYFLQALKINEAAGNKKNVAALAANIGSVYYGKKDYDNALEAYSRAAKVHEETGNKKSLLVIYSNMANVYDSMKNSDMAIQYIQKAIDLNDAMGNQQNVAALSSNIANIYKNQNNLAKSIEFYQKAIKANESSGNLKGVALNANNIGTIYFGQENYQKALEFYTKSQKSYDAAGNREGAARNSGNMGVSAMKLAQDATGSEKQDWLKQATDNLNTAISELGALGSNDAKQQFEQALGTTQAIAGGKAIVASAKRTKDDNSSPPEDIVRSTASIGGNSGGNQIDLKTEYSRKQDSIRLESRNQELNLRKEMALQQLGFEYERKQSMAKTEEEREALRLEEAQKRGQIENDYQSLLQATATEQKLAKATQEKRDAIAKAEIQKQKNIKYGSFAGGFLILIIAFFIYRNFRNQKKANVLITEANRTILIEKQRSEELLLNILPQEIADELKANGKSEARLYNEVSVLFTDFVNFTQTSERLTPQELVNELHACFSAFDRIIERNGLEKIKTIGDAYMAVCGLPESNPLHAQNTVKAGLEIRDFINERKQFENVFEVRIGINSGQVVAGIVGVKKFAYDIWGDAVNTASRMESSGESGKVNISESTYDLIKDDYTCTSRGKINAKNKGAVSMYFVDDCLKKEVALEETLEPVS